MIFFPTSRCNLKCSHCISSCTDKGTDCNKDTFKYVLSFIERVDPSILIISGGEPTIHPNIMYYIGRLIKEFPGMHMILSSNGTFIKDPALYEELIDYVWMNKLSISITYDKKYYGTQLSSNDIYKLERHCIVNKKLNDKQIIKIGRAKDMKSRDRNPRTTPMCFNIRSLMKSGLSLSESIHYLEAKGLVDTPSILPNGDISLSESMMCKPIGNVRNGIPMIESGVKKFKCVQCKYAQRCISNDKYRDILI